MKSCARCGGNGKCRRCAEMWLNETESLGNFLEKQLSCTECMGRDKCTRCQGTGIEVPVRRNGPRVLIVLLVLVVLGFAGWWFFVR